MVGQDLRNGAPVSLEAAFARVLGANALADLVRGGLSSLNMVLISGDQATGKTTIAKDLAADLGGVAKSTGALFRQEAADRGVPVEKLSALAEADLDVRLDFRAVCVIGKGDAAVFESRLSGHLGKLLRGLGRKNLVSVYLMASARERALRYVNRELSPLVRARLEPTLRALAPDATFAETLAALVATKDPDVASLATRMNEVAGRDAADRARLVKLYGIDTQDQSVFDIVIDTTGKTPQQVHAEVKKAVDAAVGQPRA